MAVASKEEREKAQEGLNLTHGWIIWACAALFYCYQFALRASPGIMTDDLMVAFQVDAYALSAAMGLYYYAYSMLQVPAGALTDYFKPRIIVTIAAALAGIGALFFAWADSVTLACVGRFLIGAGSAVGFLSCLKLGTLWFPAHKVAFVIGMTLFLGTMGGASAGLPLAWLMEQMGGWRSVMWSLGLFGFVLSALTLLIVRNKPPATLEKAILRSYGDKHNHVAELGMLEGIGVVMRKRQSWIIALYGFMMYVPLSVFTDLWGTPFFTSVYGLDKSTAAFVNSLIYIGLGVAAPFASFCCNFFKAYRPVILFSGIVPLILLALVFYVPIFPLWALEAMIFISGAFLSGQFMAFSITCSTNPLSVSGTAGGFHNMICMFSGVLIGPLVGWILEHTWQGALEHQIHQFTYYEFSWGLSTIILSLLIACCSVFFIEERY